MGSERINKEDIRRLRQVVKKAGIRRTCSELGHNSTDIYYNLINGRSSRMDNYQALLDKAIEIIINEDDHAE
jgi:hypothetical protein